MRSNRFPPTLGLALALLFSCALLAAGQTATPANPAPSNPPASQPAPRPFVLIDAAHGGTDSGAILSPAVSEKDVTLALARRLRQELNTRGIPCQLLRDGDVTLTSDQRAGVANATNPPLYISLHASSMGTGLRIFTAMLPISDGGENGLFLDWEKAQSASLDRSKAIQEKLAAAIQKMGFPVRSLIAPLRPLNNIKGPALAVEVAPTTSDVTQLATANYQAMVCAALANALASLGPSLRPAQGSAP